MNAVSLQTDDLRIRVGEPDDIRELMTLAMASCDENGFLNPNPEKIMRVIYGALLQTDGIVGCIGKPHGMIEGAVLLHVGGMWYADDLVVEELGLFIHPDFRTAKGGRAKRLAEFSKMVAERLNKALLIGVLSNSRTEAKIRMYKRIFGQETGAWFLYNSRTDTNEYLPA